MLVPRHWASADGGATDPDGKRYRFRLWGWSQESEGDALAMARQRLADLVARITSGAPAGAAYLYGKQPLREEIVRTVGEAGSPSEAVVTRNRYGALVLNTAQVPFVDVDAPAAGGLSRLLGRLRRAPPADPVLERIREACRASGRHAFRIYRTKAGYRVLATDLLLDPRAESTQDFLARFAADPWFMKLCKLQGSFRARLTPKPWRCGCPLPPGRHPRRDEGVQRAFEAWREAYESASGGFAACHYLETVGAALPSSKARAVVDEHDRVCGAQSGRPLA